ncbi:MAG: T9SS type A sorting domain-containing protein [Bacteroidetes bacterium]|nr:T9SS type A sorting domain-containing protein [Bacteroidota bacterium]
MKTICIILLLLPGFAFAQRQGDIWFFGDSAGLDFSSGSPVMIDSGQVGMIYCPQCHSEGSSSIADVDGRLLMYSDGSKVWDRRHLVMPNGDSLMSNVSATQSSLILPLPGSSHEYYLFTVDDLSLDQLRYGFRYSVVDMCLHEGYGDIEAGKKNILLLDTVTEKLTAVKHADGQRYWVIVHTYGDDAFHAYLLGPSGITDTVVSHTGSVHITSSSYGIGAQGQMKASPDGTMLAVANLNVTPGILEYFSFDKQTGVVSRPVSLQWNPYYGFYGLSFSRDNTKLYAACTLNGNGLYQFDLTAGGGDTAAVRASRVQLAGTYNYLALQLANNGKIYVARSPFAGNHYIGVINYPDSAGVLSQYQDSAVDLGRHVASYGFPNFLDSYDYGTQAVSCTTGLPDPGERFASIYPDPFAGEIHVDLSGNEAFRFSLTDLTGKTLVNSTGRGETVIQVQGLSSGIYIYTVTDGAGHVETGKLVKE